MDGWVHRGILCEPGVQHGAQTQTRGPMLMRRHTCDTDGF